jgi:hypothetical protein
VHFGQTCICRRHGSLFSSSAKPRNYNVIIPREKRIRRNSKDKYTASEKKTSRNSNLDLTQQREDNSKVMTFGAFVLSVCNVVH